ncbi:MAG: DHH family phosphoesterase [Deltaproteobacteria bacterium]|nr:DHH family phosphoesterase [Deltaproteobacteria bacterium]
MALTDNDVTSEIQVPLHLASEEQAAHDFDLTRALATLAGRRSIGVYMHDNPDPDSMAAAWGLAKLLEAELGAKVTLVLAGIVGRAENRAMVEELRIPLVPLHELDPQTFDALAIVDSQPGTGNNSLPSDRAVDVIVDHHPFRGTERSPWCDIRSDMGATSTIILQYLRERAIPLDVNLATALFYAVKTETRDLGREASDAERAAYLHLVSLVDHDRLYRVCHPKVPKQHFMALDRAVRSAQVYGDVVAANLDELFYPDLVAEIADLLLTFDGARFAVCVGRYKGKVYVSLRTEVDDTRAGGLIRKIIGTEGAAGGHGTMAGGSLSRPVETAAELEVAFAGLVERLLHFLSRAPTAGSALLPPTT